MDMPTVGAKFSTFMISRQTRYVSGCGEAMLNSSCFETMNPVLCIFQPLLVHDQSLCRDMLKVFLCSRCFVDSSEENIM